MRTRRDRRHHAPAPAVVVGEVDAVLPVPPVGPRAGPARLVPDALIVVVLRDPVERAFSHYKERRSNGTEPLSFAEAIDGRGRPARRRGSAHPRRATAT